MDVQLNDVNEVAEALKTLQSEVKNSNADVEKKLTDALLDYQEKQQKEHNKLQEEIKKRDADLKLLEAQLSRPNLNGEEGEQVWKTYDQAINKYLKTGEPITSEVLEDMNKKFFDSKTLGNDRINFDFKNLLAGSNPDGGYLVFPEFLSNKKVTREFETSPVRAVASVMTTTSDSVEIIIDDNEASAEWVGETENRNVTDTPKIGKLTIEAHELAAQPQATQKLLDDAVINFDDWLLTKIADKFRRLENTAFVSGDGNKKPKGFLSYDAWASAGVYERGKVEQINSGVAGNFKADSFISLQNGLKESYQANASWMMKRATFGEVMKLKDGTGQYLINQNLIQEVTGMALLGKPVNFADDIQGVGADALSVVYGDFGQGYLVVDRLGIVVLRDPYTAKPYIKFYSTKRTGGAVTNYEALKIMKLAA